jgi:hypothetical protein
VDQNEGVSHVLEIRIVTGLPTQPRLALARQPQRAIAIVHAPTGALFAPLDVPADTHGATFLQRQDTFLRITTAGHDLFNSQMIRSSQPC